MKTSLLILFTSLLLFSCNNYDNKSIIGTPKRLDKIEIAQTDFPKTMNWIKAKKACASLGDGWRLPTIDELNQIYLNKDKIGGFDSDYSFYWSSSEFGEYDTWFINLNDGKRIYYGHGNNFKVRAVRTF